MYTPVPTLSRSQQHQKQRRQKRVPELRKLHAHPRAAFDLVTEKEFEYDINFIRDNLKWGPAPSLPTDAPPFVPGSGSSTPSPMASITPQAPVQQQVGCVGVVIACVYRRIYSYQASRHW